jgi:hypothetical protein
LKSLVYNGIKFKIKVKGNKAKKHAIAPARDDSSFGNTNAIEFK